MNHKILCLDDEPSNNDTIMRLLRGKYDVTAFTEPTEALKSLEKEKYTLLLSDQRMPDMSGVEFLKESRKILPDAMRILVTGYSDIDTVIEAINDGGIYRYIAKPWESQELLQTVSLAADTYETRILLKEKNQQLEKALKQLKGLEKAKTDFMILINHELKTPLTSIISFKDLLLEEKLTEDQMLYVKKIDTNSDRLHKLIDDTMLIMTLRQGQDSKEITSITPAEKIEAALQDAQQQFSNKTIDFDLDLQTGGIDTSEKLFHKIISAALSNIFNHGKDSSKASIKSTVNNGKLSLFFSNEFEGNIKFNPQTLLTPFATNENIMNHSKGSGLGLPIIHAICESLGGNIELSTDKKYFNLTINI